jgi:hypothetical protein
VGGRRANTSEAEFDAAQGPQRLFPGGVGDRLGGYDSRGKDDSDKGQKDYEVMHGFTPWAACVFDRSKSDHRLRREKYK